MQVRLSYSLCCSERQDCVVRKPFVCLIYVLWRVYVALFEEIRLCCLERFGCVVWRGGLFCLERLGCVVWRG